MKFIPLFLCVIFIGGCFVSMSQKPLVKDVIVAKIDNYVITQEEFNESYKNSSHNSSTHLQSRRDFLNNMINQKLILLDAQARGLDKNKEFLKMIESFWQQSLLTLALKEKSKEGVDLDRWVNDLRKKSKIQIYGEHIQ